MNEQENYSAHPAVGDAEGGGAQNVERRAAVSRAPLALNGDAEAVRLLFPLLVQGEGTGGARNRVGAQLSDGSVIDERT